eukprot:Skav233368  [mRNA]  locus=scaffold394:611111:613811:- [translate_table: standard]
MLSTPSWRSKRKLETEPVIRTGWPARRPVVSTPPETKPASAWTLMRTKSKGLANNPDRAPRTTPALNLLPRPASPPPWPLAMKDIASRTAG